MKDFQLVPFLLRAPTFGAGSNDTVSLEALPETSLGRIAHVAGFQFDVTVTPTFTTAPTVVGINNIVRRLEFNDGQQPRFQGGFNPLRFFELMENGKLRVPDPDTNSGSTNTFNFSRYLPMGPWGLAGNPSDFLLPCSALKTGRLEFNWGALTDFSADTTVLTVAMRITAWLAFLDKEVRIPPFYDRNTYSISNADASLNGRSLYVCGGLANSASWDAITAGDFSAIQVSTGAGELPQVSCSELTRAFHTHMNSGHINQINGEPRAATDDNSKIVNSGTPTALVAADNALQMWAWSPWGTRVSKLALMAESALRVRWPSGSQATGIILAGRILAQAPGAQAAIGARALQKLGMKDQSAKVKTLSKADYRGPRAEFMPLAVKVG